MSEYERREYIVLYECDGDTMFDMRTNERIVRCKDCKHYIYADKEHSNDDWCEKHNHIAWSVNGFCAWGERRTDDN